MRVLLWMISSGNLIKGGHQTQITQTAAHLEALGVRTHMAFDHHPDIAGFDLVHSFGLDPTHIRRCHAYGMPVITSTIYGERSCALGIHPDREGWAAWVKRVRLGLSLGRSALLGTHVEKCEDLVRRQINLRVVYEMSDLLLPNSESEGQAIKRELNVSTPYVVAPNAVDPTIFCLPQRPAAPRQGVLAVGRYEPAKNTLRLIQALAGSSIPLRVIGFSHPHHENYMQECRRAAGRCRNVSIEPARTAPELAVLYGQARVHVLPSWFETTGLVSLEAALCGCNIVTTNRGFARDYFGDLAWYCDPGQVPSIRQAVEAAYAAPFQSALRERILDRYTWQHTAEATLRGYEIVLSQRDRRRAAEACDALQLTEGTTL